MVLCRCCCCRSLLQAAWSCKAAPNAAAAAQARCTFVRAAWALCPRVCGGSGDAIFAENAVSDSLFSAKKMERIKWSFFALCACLCACHACC